MRIHYLPVLVILALLARVPAVRAQSQAGFGISPAPTAERFKEERQEQDIRTTIRKKETQDRQVISAPEIEPEINRLSDQQVIFVENISVSRSEILSDEEISSVIRPYLNRKVSIKELYAMLDQFNTLYREQGYALARAILPPQRIVDRSVDVQLIEPTVDRLRVEGNKSTRRTFVMKRVEQKEGEIIDLGQLEKDLVRMSSLYDISVRSTLEPGSKFATSLVNIVVDEPNRFSALVFTDNAGRDEIGLYRYGTYATMRSVFGVRDAFNVGGVFAEGMSNFFVSYDLPVNTMDTRLGVSFDFSDTEIVSGPLQAIDVVGEFTDVGVYGSHPLIVEDRRIVKGVARFDYKESTNAFDNLFTYEGTVLTLNMGVDALLFLDKGYAYTRHTLTNGFDEFNQGDRYFVKYNGDVDFRWRLNEEKDLYVQLRGKLQLASDELLPSSEQFQAGGIATVRGFPEGMLIGDNG